MAEKAQNSFIQIKQNTIIRSDGQEEEATTNMSGILTKFSRKFNLDEIW